MENINANLVLPVQHFFREVQYSISLNPIVSERSYYLTQVYREKERLRVSSID